MKVEISTLTVKVNEKEVTLTLEEAKALFDTLNGIFGPKYTYNYGGGSGTYIPYIATGPSSGIAGGVINGQQSGDITNNLSIVGDK